MNTIQPLTQLPVSQANPNWREVGAMVGLAVAVSGLAAAIFSGLSWIYAAAFAVLTATSLLNWKLARSYFEWERWSTAGVELHNANLRLQSSEQRLTESLTQIQREREALNGNIATLRQENEQLQRNALEARQLNLGLQAVNQSLQTSEQNLRDQKSSLQKQNQLFEANTGLLRDQLAQVEQRNVQFSQNIGGFHSAISQISSIESGFSRNAGAMRQNLSDFSQLISRHGDVSQRDQTVWRPGLNSLHSPMSRLRVRVAELENLSTNAQQYPHDDLSGRLRTINAQVDRQRSELSEMRDHDEKTP